MLGGNSRSKIMSELLELERNAIERIKAFEPEEGYYLAFSGGKDSVVCKALLDMANVKYDATYRVTSVDPPELVRFIKDQHPDVIREVPRDKNSNPITMWNLIPRKLKPPTRIVRYCCSDLKESGGVEARLMNGNLRRMCSTGGWNTMCCRGR
jgi:phosphoadenosine phosphosulfate reductase